MTVRVLFFASARDAAGVAERRLELPDKATVGEARLRLRNELPDLATLLDQSALAVNDGYARHEQVLADGDELAVLPPVSGG